MFRRRRSDRPLPDELHVSVIAVDVDDDDRGAAERAAAREQAWRDLRAIVAEAVIWQDAAEDVLLAISRREPLAELAPRGGPLVRRFCELRDRLPESDDVELRRITEVLGPVLAPPRDDALVVAGHARRRLALGADRRGARADHGARPARGAAGRDLRDARRHGRARAVGQPGAISTFAEASASSATAIAAAASATGKRWEIISAKGIASWWRAIRASVFS